MDAVVQVEAAEVRAVVTNTNVIIFSGRQDDSFVFTWTTVHTDNFTFIRTSIKSNAPNSSAILV